MGRLRKPRDPWRSSTLPELSEEGKASSRLSALPSLSPRAAAGAPAPLADLRLGVIGTGDMASAHTHRWATAGASVFVGSRDASRGQRIADFTGKANVQGGSVSDALARSDVVLLCVPPGRPSLDLVVAHRAALRGKCVVEMSASYAGVADANARAPAPHEDQMSWLAKAAADDTISWCKAFSCIPAAAVRDDAREPVEIAGDARAKAAVSRLLTHAGWDVLDCGGAADAIYLEDGGPKRRPHETVALANKAKAQAAYTGPTSFFDDPNEARE